MSSRVQMRRAFLSPTGGWCGWAQGRGNGWDTETARQGLSRHGGDEATPRLGTGFQPG